MKQLFGKYTNGSVGICIVSVILGSFYIMVGCASLPGDSVKTYPSDYHTTVRASSDTLEELKIPVTETIADGLKTTLKARRTDGTPVVVQVVRISRTSSQVTVRTGSVGIGDQRVAAQINEFIHERLDTGKSASSKLGFTEENLDDSADQQIAAAAPASDADDQVWNRSPEKVAEMLSDSIFIIYFSQNSNELSNKAKEKLDQVVEIMRYNPAANATLNGYTDSYGAKSYNEMISEVRASMVKAYLVGKGISSEKIQTFGHGAQKFIGSNKTLDGRRMNRRVEIELSHVKKR